jgi:hypothetical protein
MARFTSSSSWFIPPTSDIRGANWTIKVLSKNKNENFALVHQNILTLPKDKQSSDRRTARCFIGFDPYLDV